MKKLFITQDLTSFVNRGWKVVPAVIDTIPVTLSLVIGAAVVIDLDRVEGWAGVGPNGQIDPICLVRS